jgi:hypothetical protein
VLNTLDGQVPQIVQGLPYPSGIKVAAAGQPAPHRGHLEIDQRRGGESFATQPVPNQVSVRAIIE